MSCKVLVVDDEAQVRVLFSDLLKKEKCTVTSVSYGEEAVDLIGKEDFDLVLLDIKLLGISGFEALKKIKELKPGLNVVMVTGFGYDNELVAKAKDLGCTGYIGKNMPIAEIMKNIKPFLTHS